MHVINLCDVDRPAIAPPCVNGRYPTQINERAYLGTDKSVPYNNHHGKRTNDKIRTLL